MSETVTVAQVSLWSEGRPPAIGPRAAPDPETTGARRKIPLAAHVPCGAVRSQVQQAAILVQETLSDFCVFPDGMKPGRLDAHRNDLAQDG